MKVLSATEVQKNKEKYQAMVGKQVTVIVTGATVMGTVTEFIEDAHTFNLKVEHEPVNWGGDIYTSGNFFARKSDDWGSLNNTKVLSEYEIECINEMRQLGMSDLNGPQAVAILEPSHGPENFYCDGMLNHKDALATWKTHLSQLGLYDHQVRKANQVIFG